MVLGEWTSDLCVGVACRLLGRQAGRGGIGGWHPALSTDRVGGRMDDSWGRAPVQVQGRLRNSIR
jgi:hypothetical protein